MIPPDDPLNSGAVSRSGVSENEKNASGGVPLVKKEPPRIAATWQIKEPTDAWEGTVPTSELPFFTTFKYSHDYVVNANGCGGWRVIGGTRRGRMHANAGTHREDAFAHCVNDTCAVFAVCDGAGSSKFSRVGSEFTARRIVESISIAITGAPLSIRENDAEKPAWMKKTVRESVAAICTELIRIAGVAVSEPRDFRCTLILVIQLKTSGGDEFWFSQVGDGFIGIEAADSTARWGSSDSGEYSGEVGCFIPDPESSAHAAQTLERKDGAGIVGIALASDGIEDPYFPITRNVRAIFHQLRAGVDQPLEDFSYRDVPGPVLTNDGDKSELAKWLAFEKRGENDDRTILLLYRTIVT